MDSCEHALLEGTWAKAFKWPRWRNIKGRNVNKWPCSEKADAEDFNEAVGAAHMMMGPFVESVRGCIKFTSGGL